MSEASHYLRIRTAAAIGLAGLALGGEFTQSTSVVYADQCTMEETADKVVETCTADDGTITQTTTTTETVGYDDKQTLVPNEQDHSDNTGARDATRPENTERANSRSFVNFNQGDWGPRIASTGCGPTSIAMVVSKLTPHYRTPQDITNIISPKYYIPGSGTREEAFRYIGKRYNLKVEKTDFNEATRDIKLGGMAIVHANEAISTHFTGAGHYMVLKALINGKFIIADPNGKGRSRDSERKTGWSPKQLRAYGVDGIWTFEPK